MKKLIAFALAFACAAEAPMGSTTDWWAFGGDSLHDGWEKSEQRFTKDEVKDFRLLWQQNLDNPRKGVGAIMPPVVLGRLIGYRGFKELAFVAGNGNNIWSIDSDLDRIYWEKYFPPAEKSKSKACAGELTAEPALPAPTVFHAPVPGKPARPRPVNRFGGARPVFLLTGDGMLRQLHQSDGSDFAPPKQFIPAGVPAQPLNVSEDVIYTTSHAACGQSAAVWSLDTTDPQATVQSFKLDADPVGLGLVIDSEGTVFLETNDGSFDPDNGKYGGSLLSLKSDLTVNQYFVMPEGPKKSDSEGMNQTAPTAFTYKGTELVVTAAKDGRLYLLKSKDLGTADHHHYLSRSVVVPAMDGEKAHGIWGGLASWEDADGTRYVVAPVWGPLSVEMLSAVKKTSAPNGSIAVFKVVDDKDRENLPTLRPVWVSSDMDSPSIPVIAKGVVFGLSNGKFAHSFRAA